MSASGMSASGMNASGMNVTGQGRDAGRGRVSPAVQGGAS